MNEGVGRYDGAIAARSLLTLTTLPLSERSTSDRSGQMLVAPQP